MSRDSPEMAYNSVYQQLQHAQRVVNQAILGTPTSPLRDEITQVNMYLMSAISKMEGKRSFDHLLSDQPKP